MKPTVISAANANSSANSANVDPNAINIPINHDHAPHYANAEATANAGSYGSPRQQPQHQIPAHFQQSFGFEPDMDIDMDMFPRERFRRMHHDPFAGFNSSHFGFPQFGSMGRRRMQPSAADGMGEDSDFFDRLPNEFRHYIPDGFGHRRAGSGTMPQHPQHHAQQQMPPQQHYQYQSGTTPPNSYANMPPQSPSKKLCDAAIQTEDPSSGVTTSSAGVTQDQVDHAVRHNDNLNQHGLRNTVDMGVKTNSESEQLGPRAHSAPPPEQMQQNNGGQARRVTPPQQTQFGTQTSPQTPNSANAYQKAYYPPQQQAHPMQKQGTPPPAAGGQAQPQTPGGTYIRTIPIFVEGRSEPIINAHKEIPNQNQPPSQSQQTKAHPHPQQQQQFYNQQQQQPHYATGAQHPHPNQQQQQQQHHQQQQRPAPLNTQPQQPPQQQAAGGPPPQTPHTLDSINKIQDIQRDVLELMAKVEKFTGTRQDKEYVYLDEMLTRNLLKLDTIDTQGKDSIRLARKEAIKCIQASINVLEAKAEENAKTAQAGNSASADNTTTQPSNTEDASSGDISKAVNEQSEATDESKAQDPIPLPPPAADEKSTDSNAAAVVKEASPAAEAATGNSATNETK